MEVSVIGNKSGMSSIFPPNFCCRFTAAYPQYDRMSGSLLERANGEILRGETRELREGGSELVQDKTKR